MRENANLDAVTVGVASIFDLSGNIIQQGVRLLHHERSSLHVIRLMTVVRKTQIVTISLLLSLLAGTVYLALNQDAAAAAFLACACVLTPVVATFRLSYRLKTMPVRDRKPAR